MLETLRKSAGSWVAKILFGILILSFGIWGIGDVIRGGGDQGAAIKVGEIEYGADYVRSRFDQQVEQMRQFFGPDFSAEDARRMGLVQNVVDTLVSEASLRMAAQDLGITIGEDTLRKAVFAQAAFQDDSGKFDRGRFERVLMANNLTEEAYLGILRQDMQRSRMAQVALAGAATPDILAETLFAYRQEKRKAEVLRISAADLALTETPGDDALQAVYEENEQMFTAPEYRAITAVLLTEAEMRERVDVPEERIAEYYDNNRAAFATPEQREVSQVILDSEEQAQKLAAAANGASLAAAAQSLGLSAPIDLGAVGPDDLPGGAGEAVFALDAGQVSAPVETPLGWHVFEVRKVTPPQEQPLDDVRDEIRDRIAADMAVDAMYDMTADLEDTLGGGATLEEAAESLDLSLTKVPAVSIDGMTPAGTMADLPATAREDILSAAFSLQAGDATRVREMDGGYFVVRVDAVTPPALRPFDSVRDQVVELWESRQRAAMAETLAQELADKAAGPAALAGLADEHQGVTFSETPALTRDGTADGKMSDLGRPAVTRLFAMNLNEAAWVPSQDGAIVMRLTEIIPADPQTSPQGVTAVADQLRARLGEDLFAQMVTTFRNRYGVEVNQKLIQQIF